jgi:hypothetical protein
MPATARLWPVALVLAAVACTGTAARAVAGPAAGGTLAGVARRVTTGGVMAGAGVQLVEVTARGPRGMGEGRAGPDGRFAFHGLPDGRYLVQVLHQDVVYATHATLTGGARADVVIEAYDVAAGVPLRVTFVGAAIDVHRGYVRVSEIVHLRNATTRTFLGELRLALPPRAQFVTFHEGWHRPAVDGDRLRDRLTVRPGAYRLAYSYSVAGSGTVILDRPLAVPIDRVEVFVLAPAAVLGPALTAQPATMNEGRLFNRASARSVAAGPLAMQVAGVPADARWQAPAAAGALAAALLIGLVAAALRAAATSARTPTP